MADWSEIFEQRLQTVLLDGTAKGAETAETAAGLGARLGLTPPSTRHRAAERAAVRDPTSAFFESIRKQSRTAGGGHDDDPRAVMTPAAQLIRASSPEYDSERPAVQGLQESYSNRARDLHGEAMKRLTDIQDALEAELDSMALQEDALLATVADKQAQFRRPAETWMVTIQTRKEASAGSGSGSGGGGSGTTTTTEKDERIVDRIAAIRTAAGVLESDLERLWKEWGQAQAEVTDVLRALLEAGRGDTSSDLILAKAEKELDAAAAEAMRETKENEKTFRKLILDEECKLAQTMLARQSKYD